MHLEIFLNKKQIIKLYTITKKKQTPNFYLNLFQNGYLITLRLAKKNYSGINFIQLYLRCNATPNFV